MRHSIKPITFINLLLRGTSKGVNTLIKNLACCKNKIAPQFGCEERYYKKRKRHKKYKKYKKSKYKYKKPRKRYYVKNYKYKRPYKKKKSIKECTCYNCGKLGHLARD